MNELKKWNDLESPKVFFFFLKNKKNSRFIINQKMNQKIIYLFKH